MKWATRDLIHFDRVVSAWLILRFVDPDATFDFLKEGEPPATDACPFGIPGVPLAAHDGHRTTFQRILETYAIPGEALQRLSALISDGVRHIMQDASRADAAQRSPIAAGALAITEGILLTSSSDQECLERCLSLYDALHARLLGQVVLDHNPNLAAQSILQQTLALASATRALREKGLSFSEAAFVQTLSAAPETKRS
jgi:hypothetical protein